MLLLTAIYCVGIRNTSITCSCKDPHLTLAYGGSTDFRGTNNIYNYVSSQSTSVNVRISECIFRLKEAIINGTFLTEAHVVATQRYNNQFVYFYVSVWASRLNQHNYAFDFANGTCGGKRFKLGPHRSTICHSLKASVDYSSIMIETNEWYMLFTGQPIYNNMWGPTHRIDASFAPRFELDAHGLIGQSYDGSGVPRIGAKDVYPERGNFTTKAMGEGAIEGVASDYVMGHPSDTKFKYSRFGRFGSAPNVARRLHEQPAVAPTCCRTCTSLRLCNWVDSECTKDSDCRQTDACTKVKCVKSTCSYSKNMTCSLQSSPPSPPSPSRLPSSPSNPPCTPYPPSPLSRPPSQSTPPSRPPSPSSSSSFPPLPSSQLLFSPNLPSPVPSSSRSSDQASGPIYEDESAPSSNPSDWLYVPPDNKDVCTQTWLYSTSETTKESWLSASSRGSSLTRIGCDAGFWHRADHSNSDFLLWHGEW